MDKKAVLHLLDLAVLNGYMPLSLCGGKEISHRYLLCFLRNMLALVGQEWQLESCKETTCYFCECWQTRHYFQYVLACSLKARELLRMLCERCVLNPLSVMWSSF